MTRPMGWAGIVLTTGLALAATAVASQSGGGFSPKFLSSGAGPTTANASLLTQTDAAMQAQIDADLANCNGMGIGASIETAVAVHAEMASATPNVEALFDVNNNCFSSLNQIVDLSFSIPSLSSILASAQSVLLQYAQKRICSAAPQIGSLATAPINQAIGSFNTLGPQFTEISGTGSLTSLLPSTPNFAVPATTTATTNLNPFGTTQLTFQAGRTSVAAPLGPADTSTADTRLIEQNSQPRNATSEASWWSSASRLLNERE